MRPPLEVADIFRQCGHDFRVTHTLSPEQRRVMRAIERCRTAALGGHVEQCDTCGHQRISYNSCRNRHCPKCQSLAKARWLEARLADLLPVEYFHVVFTLPEQLASVALQNKRVVYNLLFAATAETLRTIAAITRDTLARRSVFWPCYIPGAKLFAIIPISIASFPVVV
jgi:Transposase zinc-binding domain